MAFSTESEKERELRYLRRENNREREESRRNASEIRVLKAEKERILKSLKQKEDELKKTQSDVLERFRDAQQKEGSQGGLLRNGVRNESDRLNVSVDRESEDRISLEDSYRTVDRTGMIHVGQQKEAQQSWTEDNALRKKAEIAKARRIVFSSEDRKGRCDLTDKTPLQETVSPSDKSDFAKDIGRELDILERRLSCISQERSRVQQETHSERNSREDSYLTAEERMRIGKEFAGAKLKDTTFRNTKPQGIQRTTDKYGSDLNGRKITADSGKRDSVSDIETDDGYIEGTRKYLGFSEIKSGKSGFKERETSTERKYQVQRDSWNYERKPIDPPSFLEDNKELDEGLQMTMQDIQSQMMASILQQLRIQSRQMMEEERKKMEESWTVREEESKYKSEKLFTKEKEKMEMYFATREEDIARKETELKQREDRLREREDSLKEVNALKASLIEKEQEIIRREESLIGKEEWIKQEETALLEINSLKEALLEERAQMERKLELLKEKEKELKITEQERIRVRNELGCEEMKKGMIPRNRSEIETEIPMKQELKIMRMKEVTEETTPKRPSIDAVPDENLLSTEIPIQKTYQEGKTGQTCEREIATKEIRQTVIDSQCFLPKFSPFSGDDPKPRTEASYEEWKYEVECIRKEKEHSSVAIVQSVRKSLRGRAKRVILTFGISAKIEDIMEKLENEFGNVASGQTIMKEFYTATQKETESVNEWGLRLEEIFQRAIEKGKVRKEERDATLRDQFWKSLRSERLKNATRVKYESLKSFEQLRKAVRAEESEMKLATNIAQQQAKAQPKAEKTEKVQEDTDREDKLDLILKRIEALERGRRRGGYRGGFNNRRGQYNNQNNRQIDSRNQNITTEQKSEETGGKESLKA